MKKIKNLCKIYNIGTLGDWTLKKKSSHIQSYGGYFPFWLENPLVNFILRVGLFPHMTTVTCKYHQLFGYFSGATKTCLWLVQPCEAISWCREHRKLLLLVQKLCSLLHDESSIYSISLLYYRLYCTSAWKVCRLAFVLVFSSLDTFYICIAGSRLWRTLFWSVDNRLLSGISKSYISPFPWMHGNEAFTWSRHPWKSYLEKLQYSTFVLGRKTFF